MEMEHVNENTIRVVINNEDLQERGISFLDLMGDREEVEKFFYSILEEVDDEEQFQDSDMVTFQVLPNRNGLELYISKNIDLMDGEIPIVDLTKDNGEKESGSYRDLIREKMLSLGKPEVEFPLPDSRDLNHSAFIFKFFEIEDLIELTKVFKGNVKASNLYAYEGDYYLELIYPTETTPFEKGLDLSVMLEYGIDVSLDGSFLAEHGNVLIRQDALHSVNHYFNS